LAGATKLTCEGQHIIARNSIIFMPK